MSHTAAYEKWLTAALAPHEADELRELSEDERTERFCRALEFGTAGLRGLVGMGTNRMNIYTVRQAAYGFARALTKSFAAPRAAVCYDARHDSREFAEQCAAVLAGQGVSVYMFREPRPTPLLSFVIRDMALDGGINITASHNPKGYSGLKVYWRGGAQITGETAATVADEMLRVSPFDCAPAQSFEQYRRAGAISPVGIDADERFISACLDCVIDREAAARAGDMKIVYTPFHGVGGAVLPRAFARAGFKNLICVPEQIEPDGDFPTLADPNPENATGFELAVKLAEKERAHLIIGTDPDADRVAALAKNSAGEWTPISGNQMGALLLEYITSAKKRMNMLPKSAALVQTIVTGGLSLEIARQNGIFAEQTFTGFRFMAEKVEQLAADGIQYLLAFEEAIGYMLGSHVRDKDGVTAALLIAEMAAYRHARGHSLIDALHELWRDYGSFAERTVSLPFPGAEGAEQMRALTRALRQNPPRELCGLAVESAEDYLSGVAALAGGESVELDKRGMDVLIFRLSGGASLVVRPSGTEPKIKIYVHAKAKTPAKAEDLAEILAQRALERLSQAPLD